MKNAKKLNEQMIRIKSLFTEERLWGNIINEACDSEQEAADYLEKAGYVVSAPGNSATQKARRDLINCLEQPAIKDIYEIIKDHENKVKIEISDRSDIGCVLLITSKNKVGDWISITMYGKKLFVYYIFEDPGNFSSILGKLNIDRLIKYIGYEGDIDGEDYKNLKFKKLYDIKGRSIVGSATEAAGRFKIPKYEDLSGGTVKYEEILFKNTDVTPNGKIKELVVRGTKNNNRFKKR